MDLHARAVEATATARAAGALEPIDTDAVVIMDDGLPFRVRLPRTRTLAPPAPGNPFVTPEPALTLGDWPPAHRLVLNKYPVFPDHLLVVTRQFAEQAAPLDPGDVEAAWRVLEAEDAVVFYNGGATAGASQRHRHLQAVWPPLGPGPGRFPTEARLFAGDLPFRVLAGSVGPGPDALYRDLDAAVADAGGLPWNLLLTRDAFALVPRRAEAACGVSVNALGFAGSLLARDEATLAALRDVGPLALLTAVATPR